MAYSYEFECGGPISLEEFVCSISENIDVNDADSLQESARYLHALSLNTHLFDDVITDAIERNASIGGLQESFNAYTDATFLLDGCPNQSFYVRANVWKKPKEIAGRLDFQNEKYSYEAAHDHNFDFVTVGYFGPGYRTRIYEYDHSKITGQVGELVDITLLEETTLPTGKVMMYRKSVDIHTQMPPTDTSISVNLMVPPPWEDYKEQYYFDVENGAVGGFVMGPVNYQVSVLSLAADIGDESMLDPLIAIATGSACARTRASAIDTVLKIAPNMRDMMLSRCGTDPHPLVAKSLSFAL